MIVPRGALCVGFLFAPLLIAQSAIRGFPTAVVPDEQKWEAQALEIPDAAALRRNMDFLAGEPHTAGSPRSRVVAQYIAARLKDWGLSVRIERFEALMPYPTVRQLEVVGPTPYVAKLAEPALAEDPSSSNTNQIPSYNAYSASGDVTAEVVYANYGLPEDYEWLAKQGVRIKGKIVLTRYGKSWRGLKPKLAAEHGAVGCLIYSDPHEDGYFEGDAYPVGPMRPADGVQRGSVMDMVLYPGDPLSPGWASERGSKRLPMQEAKTLMKIPVLPISYADAQPILQQLKGPLTPHDWRGALPLTYHAGSGPVKVHLHAEFDWTTKPLYDVIATIPGSEEPDEWVIAGNHHDAWVNGADDPISGTSALMETARALGALQKAGWKPRRTIYLAFWDGEEFGLLGSTEWVEKHQEELRKSGVAYLNSDDTGRGWLNVSGSHTLEAFAAEAADAVQQPGANMSTAEYFVHHPPAESMDVPGTPPRTDTAFTIGALGAGSDYQGFLDYLGIASLNSQFSGQTKSGIYHSVYDDVYWYRRFSDGSYADGKALSQFTLTEMLRLADAPILPFEFGHFANTLTTYADEIAKEADTAGRKLEFAGLRKQLDVLKEKAQNYNALLEAASLKRTLDESRLERLNLDLIHSERTLTRPEGLPNRPWYKHQVYAPGFYSGYAVKTLPGIREAVETKNWKLAEKESGVMEQCLTDLNQTVAQAIEDLAGL